MSFIEQPSKVFLIGFFDGVELYQSLNYPFEDCFQVSSLSFPLHYLYFFLFHSNLLVRQAEHSFVYVVFPLCSLQAIVPSICNQIYYSLQNRKHSFSLLFPSFIDTLLHQWQWHDYPQYNSPFLALASLSTLYSLCIFSPLLFHPSSFFPPNLNPFLLNYSTSLSPLRYEHFQHFPFLVFFPPFYPYIQ